MNFEIFYEKEKMLTNVLNKRAVMALDRSTALCNVISNAKHIKTIILTKIQNATSRVLTTFSFIWPRDLFFLPDMTHIHTWTRYHHDKHSDIVLTCSS